MVEGDALLEEATDRYAGAVDSEWRDDPVQPGPVFETHVDTGCAKVDTSTTLSCQPTQKVFDLRSSDHASGVAQNTPLFDPHLPGWIDHDLGHRRVARKFVEWPKPIDTSSHLTHDHGPSFGGGERRVAQRQLVERAMSA